MAITADFFDQKDARPNVICFGFARGQNLMHNSVIAWCDDTVLWAGFLGVVSDDHVHNRLRHYFKDAPLVRDDDGAIKRAKDIETVWAQDGDAKISLYGTQFQRDVWKSLLNIPKGKTVCYQDIANDIGRPRAVRAVGSAVGANPISLLVPCHRVIHKDGGLSHYAWGRDVKAALLNAEGAAFNV